MSVCPLKNNEYGHSTECVGDECTFADENGECLIALALKIYVEKDRDHKRAEKFFGRYI